MRNIMPLQSEFLLEAAPHYHKKKDLETLGLERKVPRGEGAAGERSKM
jgi:pre-mRNA-splicing factor ATP-dependent RNA helicase DHX16